MSQPPDFVDNQHAPEVFATAASGFFLLAGNVHITFEAIRIDHSSSPGPAHRVVIGRLVLPITGAQGLAAGLYDFLKTHGLALGPDPADANKPSIQ